MLILNTGGTFNKRYNHLTGEVEVPYDNFAIENILDSFVFDYDLAGLMYKDSFEIDANDRKMLANIIMESIDTNFVIIHGTDTMHETAEFLSEIFEDRKIILTGAMKPFEIDPIESSVNLGMSVGFLQSLDMNGVYICMNGNIVPWDKISKNRVLGKFELV